MPKRKKSSLRCSECSGIFGNKQKLLAYAETTGIRCCLNILSQCPHCKEYFESTAGRDSHIRQSLSCRRRHLLTDDVSKISFNEYSCSTFSCSRQTDSTSKSISLQTSTIDESLNVTQTCPQISSKKFVSLPMKSALIDKRISPITADISSNDVEIQSAMSLDQDVESQDDVDFVNITDDDSFTDLPQHRHINIDTEMDAIQEKILNHRKNCEESYTDTDKAMIMLHNLLKDAGSPSYLFDKIIKWTQENSQYIGDVHHNIPSKDKFLKTLESKLFTEEVAYNLKPRIEKLSLTNENAVSLTSFSFKHQLISLLTNERLMEVENLLINPDNPFDSVPKENCMLDDLNSGWWYRETHTEICTDPTKEILLPIVLFIDGGKVTERLSLEPIVFTLGIFNRATRNKPDAWRTLGYIEGKNNYSDPSYTQNKKQTAESWREYHKIIDRLIGTMKCMLGRDNGFEWTLYLKGKRFKVVFKLAIQLILGDCEGHKKLCLHFGTTNSNILCRHCHVSFHQSDDPDHVCIPMSMDEVTNKTNEELELLSKYNVPNAFHGVYFGARDMTIYQSTPPEPLHGFQLGLVLYMSKHFFNTVGRTKIMTKIETFVRYFVRTFPSQTLRDYPSTQSVQNNLRNPGTLSATEQYNRLFALYLAVLTPDVYKSLENHLTVLVAKKWVHLFERSLCYYQWLMKTEHPPAKIQSRHGRDSLAQIEIRKYLKEYKHLMKDRNDTTGVKFIKFHDNLHYVQGIDGHGSVQNWDTGRPESNAISHYKRNVKLTQRRQQNLSLQISIKHYEDLIMREASIAVKMDKKSDSSSRKMTSRLSGSTYKMTHHHDEDANGDVSDNIQIEWCGRIRPSFFPQKICLAICKKLFVAERGVYHLDSSSIVSGRTEYIDANGNRYRAHPNYNGKPWFDWCYVRWDAYTDEYPCKIICFLQCNSEYFCHITIY